MTIFPEFQRSFFFHECLMFLCLPIRFPGLWKIIVLATEYVEPLHDEVLATIMNDFLYPSDSKMYGNEPQFNETLL